MPAVLLSPGVAGVGSVTLVPALVTNHGAGAVAAEGTAEGIPAVPDHVPILMYTLAPPAFQPITYPDVVPVVPALRTPRPYDAVFFCAYHCYP